ncbi:MAG: hypothetical protein MR945_09320 [Agathobacter sp.]|nr:hypothetical protein [Agathobacter sp.]
MARKQREFTIRTWVIDSKTGDWMQIDIKDIPEEKKDELRDRFALGAGYERVK